MSKFSDWWTEFREFLDEANLPLLWSQVVRRYGMYILGIVALTVIWLLKGSK